MSKLDKETWIRTRTGIAVTPEPEVIRIPPFQTPAKPRYGDACNGCGWCCHMSVCPIGERTYPGAVAPCPGIVYHDGKVRCQVVMNEIGLKKPPIIQGMLGIGTYCDSTINEQDADIQMEKEFGIK